MHITVVAVGTRGDVQPLVALALGLRRAGYGVCVATTGEFETLVCEHGLEFFRLSGSPSDLMQGADMLAAMGGNKNPVTLVRGILNAVRPQFVQGMAEIWQACQGSDAIIVSMLGFLGAYSAAEKLGIPCIEGYVLPARPTRAFSSVLMGFDLRLGGTVNYLSHALILNLAWRLFDPVVNHARREALALPPSSLRRAIREQERRHVPVLNGYSPLALPKPPDWPSWHHVTGWWFLERPPDWPPPEGLLRFLADGPPPVSVGFGSMTGRDPQRITALVLEALHRAGLRGVLVTGWGGATIPADLPADQLYVLDAVPYDWLFPRMAAVVHHGGSGTTAAGLQAGVPSVLVPFGGDQFLWGRCVRRIGVGPDPIPRGQLSAEKLAYALRSAANHAPLRQRAAALGAQIRAEDGVGQAVRVIARALGAG